MNAYELIDVIRTQEEFLRSQKTLDVGFRLESLRKLKGLLVRYDDELTQTLRLDLGKHPFESYASEHGFAIQEINIMIRNLKRWSRPKFAPTPAVHWPARSFYINRPYGRVLIISPWNYPLQLMIMPLIGAMAAGNCILAKPSRHAVHTSNLIRRIIGENFDPGHISIVEGGGEINRILLEQQYDYIFFTGSTEIGKKVMAAAAQHLTPVSLELGGKSPVIVEPDFSPALAARRILWGKLLNAGQSCVAPDYLLVHRDIKDDLLREMETYLLSMYGKNIAENDDYARIINESAAGHLAQMIEGKKILIGGETDPAAKYIAPTVVEVDDMDDVLMREEVFGPVLPLVEYHDLDDALEIIRAKPKPLALYAYTRSKKTWKRIIRNTDSGSGGINETVVHFINPYLPFGGVGSSGMGRYHGKYSYQTFSYKRSFLKKSSRIDIPLRYPPYKKKTWLIKLFVR